MMLFSHEYRSISRNHVETLLRGDERKICVKSQNKTEELKWEHEPPSLHQWHYKHVWNADLFTPPPPHLSCLGRHVSFSLSFSKVTYSDLFHHPSCPNVQRIRYRTEYRLRKQDFGGVVFTAFIIRASFAHSKYRLEFIQNKLEVYVQKAAVYTALKNWWQKSQKP